MVARLATLCALVVTLSLAAALCPTQQPQANNRAASPQSQDPEPQSQDKEYDEYEVKAAYLLQFLRYVSWPRQEGEAEAPLVIGIVGKSPFGKVFDSVDGKQVEGTKRKLSVKHFAAVPKDEELRACHILFVCRSEHDRLDKILASVADHPVLTVTEGDRMIERGVAFGFVLDKRKVRIEYNSEATQKARLKVSAQLQRVVVRRR